MAMSTILCSALLGALFSAPANAGTAETTTLDPIHAALNTDVEPNPAGPAATAVSTSVEMAGRLRGRTVRVGALTRTDGAEDGALSLWLRAVLSDGSSVVFQDGAPSSTAWARHEIVADIPADAQSVVLGASFSGDGAAWVDGFTLHASVNKGWTQWPLDNPGFEKNRKGWTAQGADRSTRIDRTGPAAGRRALRFAD